MNELAPRLTNDGKAYIIGAMNGDGITFTKMVIGNGVPVAGATPSMVGPQIEIGFTQIEVHDDYCILTGSFDNSEVEEGFYIYEIGVFAENTSEQEVLYAYRYMNTNVDFVPAADSGNVLETEISIVVSIGDADNVTAVLIEGSLYANKQAFENHLADHSNPHQVTKAQVGLDKVENNYFYDNTIIVDEPEEESEEEPGNVATDDTLREAMSKIWYWIDQLINGGFVPTSGWGDTQNPTTQGISGDIWFTNSIRQNYPHGIGGYMSRNDVWRIVSAGDQAINPEIYSDYSDCGYLEIATGDNAHEPIIVRQYGGGTVNFGTVVRTLYLLDYYGNTKIPGELQFFGGYRGIKWSNVENPSKTGGVSGDGAYIGLVPGTSSRDDFEIGVADDGNEQIMVRQRTYGTNIGFGGNWLNLPIKRTAYLLNVSGNTVFPGSCTATSHPTSSDLKKKDVHGEVNLETAEALIMGLQPIFYNFKGDWKESAGFGAQDVYKLAHEIGLHDNGIYRAALKPDEDGNAEGIEYHDADIEALDDADLEWNLNYTEFIPYMVRVIQDQQKRIEKLEEMLGGEN